MFDGVLNTVRRAIIHKPFIRTREEMAIKILLRSFVLGFFKNVYPNSDCCARNIEK